MSAPQSGWMRGIVKEVPSGDTVVVMAATKSGIPPEKRLTLSSLQAPRTVSCISCHPCARELRDYDAQAEDAGLF